MTDHKPLSDEELDYIAARVDRSVQLIPWSEVVSLIAQSREANRLHEQFAVDLKSFAEMLLDDSGVDVETVRHALLQQARQLLDCRGNCDPAARAKRELGEWLVTDHNRAFHVDHNNGAYQCRLWEYYDGETQYSHSGVGKEPTEAITAAIRAAKESGR